MSWSSPNLRSKTQKFSFRLRSEDGHWTLPLVTATGQDWGALTILWFSPPDIASPGPQTENRINYLSLCDYQSFPRKIWGENEAVIEKRIQYQLYVVLADGMQTTISDTLTNNSISYYYFWVFLCCPFLIGTNEMRSSLETIRFPGRHLFSPFSSRKSFLIIKLVLCMYNMLSQFHCI